MGHAPWRRTKVDGDTVKQPNCLRCNAAFISEGPHHRLCPGCNGELKAQPTAAEVYPSAALRHLSGD